MTRPALISSGISRAYIGSGNAVVEWRAATDEYGHCLFAMAL
jgi:hypothetical protein